MGRGHWCLTNFVFAMVPVALKLPSKIFMSCDREILRVLSLW